MPRTLSGLKTGEFDTIDVSESISTHNLQTTGQFSHTGSTPAQFDTLQVGNDGDSGVRLTVNGNISCGAMTTTGLEANLSFQHATATAPSSHIYNGASTRSIDFGKLTLTKGGATAGLYAPLSSDNQTIDIPETPIPSTAVASLTHAANQSFTVDESATLISSGFGLSLSPASSTSYLVEVQFWCENDTSNSEVLTVSLTQSKSSASSVHDSAMVFEGKASKALIVYRKVLTLGAGSHEVGLAFNIEDDDDGNNCLIYYGGDYPDIVMSAQPL